MIGRPSKPPLVDNDDDDGGCDDIEGKKHFNGEKKLKHNTLGLEGGNAPF